MTKEEIIVKLVCSLNIGNSGYIGERVRYATEQYNNLVAQGIILEEGKTD
jgi:hypothetical protein